MGFRTSRFVVEDTMAMVFTREPEQPYRSPFAQRMTEKRLAAGLGAPLLDSVKTLFVLCLKNRGVYQTTVLDPSRLEPRRMCREREAGSSG